MMSTTRKRPPLGLPVRPPITALHLCADNDRNGNPRRCFVVLDSSGLFVEALDEGYVGESALAARYPWFNHRAAERLGLKRTYATRVDTTPAEYRRMLRRELYTDDATARIRHNADRYERRYDAWGERRHA